MPIPIPKRPSGYRLGSSNAPIQIEMFFDLECPFSRKGWQTILKVFKAYDAQTIYLILQPMTLGNHRQSWDATKAAIVVAQDNTEKFVDFVSYLFDHQPEFANEAFKDKTQTDWHNLLADYAVDSNLWSDQEKFIRLLNSEEIYNQARIPARFAALQGVWSTPTFFINGAQTTDLSSQSSLQDWQDKINSLL
ncbi:DsbA family protein [Crocosphaera chwakensis]|uniref:Glutathione reductase n=1 Tax=Crocosphaera chwakensis CCY0110 TaxID=391612 RepID=A3IVD0_9CHRO|nr:thioredoxin domain-containing protein [Crocosphaera chwakensis]EAZ89599.1 glutathione reductase [Crocosphaera chwakensis CCY0110]